MSLFLRALSGNRSFQAVSVLLSIIFLPEVAVSQQKVDCPGFGPEVVILKNQPYALCAAHPGAVNFAGITYGNCVKLNGNSISIAHNFPSAPGSSNPGNI